MTQRGKASNTAPAGNTPDAPAISDADIEALANDAEHGYDGSTQPSVVVGL